MGKASNWLKFDPTGATWILPVLVVAFIITGCDWVAIALGPVRRLGIPVPPVLPYAYVILPAAAGVLWLCTGRRASMAFGLLAIALTLASSIGTAQYAEHLLSRIPVTRSLEPDERATLKARVTLPFCELGDRDGEYITVERADSRRAQMVAELDKLHLLR